MDMDPEFLGCRMTQLPSVFNYRKTNIQDLDQFLGERDVNLLARFRSRSTRPVMGKFRGEGLIIAGMINLYGK
jgi:hypothetical protein